MKFCDVCGLEVAKLATSRRGRWGLDLCHTCWQRMRGRERVRRPTMAERLEVVQTEGGPPCGWPLCKLCGQDVDQHGLGYYTTKGKRRRFCSDRCKATHNSRVGAPIRAQKARQRVKAETWVNPAQYHTPESLRAAALQGAAVRAEQHQAAVEAGIWQNPADAPGAREKLSRPRTHADNPILHRAIEKLGQGLSVADLEPAEAEAHRAYRREIERQKRERPPNPVLRQARERANLSRTELGRRVGVALNTVYGWEAHGAIPRAETRVKVAEVLGCWPWPEENPSDVS